LPKEWVSDELKRYQRASFLSVCSGNWCDFCQWFRYDEAPIEGEAMKIRIKSSRRQSGVAAAKRGAQLIRDAISKRGRANIIVATGASQFEMLECLVRESRIDWTRVVGFHLDEYVGLPVTHPASFRRYLWERFVSQLPLPLAAFHYINGEGDPRKECRRVGALIRRHAIDVCFAGIGENGHLAFNDPPADFGTSVPYLVVELDEACRRQQLGEGWFKTLGAVPRRAISMSIQQILRSRAVICTVPDARKAEAVHDCLTGPVTNLHPASILQRHPACELYLDKASAKLLPAR
jgi:glucosamine-6-phosphate deaminase